MVSLEDVLLLNILSRMTKRPTGPTGGGCGCFIFLFIVIIALIIEFIKEHKVASFIILIVCIIAFIILKLIDHLLDCYLYKDETPEQRNERLETERLIKEWKNGNNF